MGFFSWKANARVVHAARDRTSRRKQYLAICSQWSKETMMIIIIIVLFYNSTSMFGWAQCTFHSVKILFYFNSE